LRLKAEQALITKLKTMDFDQIAALMKADEKSLKDDEKAMREICVRMTQLAAYAHLFPADATAKQIAVKNFKADMIEFEVVFPQKYANEKKAQAATLSQRFLVPPSKI
jgi:hypothetical protein